ncbi:MAG: FAD-binding domain-containing protein [Myxococcaceae bacterium]
MTPHDRIRTLNQAPVHPERAFVLYWMTAARRARSNFALDRALEHARTLEKPLVVFEPLRVGYAFASERLHAFVLEGMTDNARAFAHSPVRYLPYVERAPGEGRGLLEALARQSCVVVGDDWPGFFHPRMQAAAAKTLDVKLEVIDSNGLYPMHATTRVFTTAHSFRTHLQKELPPHLLALPHPRPLEHLELPRAPEPKLPAKWRFAIPPHSELSALPIDHAVKPVAMKGGTTVALTRLDHFVARALGDYAAQRNEPEVDGTSRLSPYLHFGHLGVHDVFTRLLPPRWSAESLGKSIGGKKEGWWQVPSAVESFLDELVTWRELAFNRAALQPDDYTRFDSLPAWAKASMKKHAKDKRSHVYSYDDFEQSRTHDPLWNAAMGQLRTEGWFHNNVRMLWGKKIYEWSRSGEDALRVMDQLMSRWSLDGRDPVSWSGAMWVLGRFDRAWGPERPVFGTLRYMTSQNFARKVSVKQYVARYA